MATEVLIQRIGEPCTLRVYNSDGTETVVENLRILTMSHGGGVPALDAMMGAGLVPEFNMACSMRKQDIDTHIGERTLYPRPPEITLTERNQRYRVTQWGPVNKRVQEVVLEQMTDVGDGTD